MTRLLEMFPDAIETFGYVTKANRYANNIKKTHANNAFVIAGGTTQKRDTVQFVTFKRKNNRSLQKNRKGFAPSIRRQRYQIQPTDLIKYQGRICVANIAIGSHLFSKKIPVPVIYRYDLFSGMAALEDLGDTYLQKIINELQLRNDTVQIIKWYEKTCNLLINFSIKGMENFNPSWSFQTEAYTKELIIEKECRYFLDAFICGYLQLEIKFKALKETFDFIAENAVKYSFSGLMHRDMQSRNIMVKNKQIFFIDFQAARKGPLQYDLASLLIDPYVNLDFKIREKILMYCALKISRLTGFDKNKFIHCYRFCAITRNLQILGAFAYLSMVKGKKNFKNYIPCALHNLKINVDVLNKETNGELKQIKDILDGI